MEIAEAVRLVREEGFGGARNQTARDTVLAALEAAEKRIPYWADPAELFRRKYLEAQATLDEERALKLRLVDETGHQQQALAEIERRLIGTQYHDLVRDALRDTAPRYAPGMNVSDHKPHCDILTTRDGWDADCTCDTAPAEGFFARGDDGQYRLDPAPTAPTEERHWQDDADPSPGRAQTAYQAEREREKP